MTMHEMPIRKLTTPHPRGINDLTSLFDPVNQSTTQDDIANDKSCTDQDQGEAGIMRNDQEK